MPTHGIYFPADAGDHEQIARTVAGLGEVAGQMNITTGYHKSQTDGSPGLLIAYIDAGQVYCGLAPDWPRSIWLVDHLRRLAEMYTGGSPPVECDQGEAISIAEELSDLADRIQAALDRQASFSDAYEE